MHILVGLFIHNNETDEPKQVTWLSDYNDLSCMEDENANA